MYKPSQRCMPNPVIGSGHQPALPASCSAKPPSTACPPKQRIGLERLTRPATAPVRRPSSSTRGWPTSTYPSTVTTPKPRNWMKELRLVSLSPLRIWQAASNSFATYPNDDAPEYLDGWSNTNGAPIASYNDPSVVYDFALEVNLFIVCPEATCEGGPVQTLEWGPPAASSPAPALPGCIGIR